jgi:retron-type reverse transcriptase
LFAIPLLNIFKQAQKERIRIEQAGIRTKVSGTKQIFSKTGIKQGDVLSPIVFNYVIDWIIERVITTDEGVMLRKGVQVTDIDYADDVAITEDDLLKAQMMIDKVSYYYAIVGLKINPTKTKVTCTNS